MALELEGEGEGEELLDMSDHSLQGGQGAERASRAPETHKGHALRGSSSSLSTFACEILVLPWHGSHWVEEMLLHGSAANEDVESWAQDVMGRIPA